MYINQQQGFISSVDQHLKPKGLPKRTLKVDTQSSSSYEHENEITDIQCLLNDDSGFGLIHDI